MATPDERKQLENFGKLVQNLGETKGEQKMSSECDQLWTSDYRFEWALRACRFLRDIPVPNGPPGAHTMCLVADPRDLRIALTFWKLAQFKEVRDVQMRHRMRMRKSSLNKIPDEEIPKAAAVSSKEEKEEKEEKKITSEEIEKAAVHDSGK